MSVGLIRNSKMFPGTLDGMGHVCFFRHALALDERRVKFLPEYAYGGTSVAPISRHPSTAGKNTSYGCRMKYFLIQQQIIVTRD